MSQQLDPQIGLRILSIRYLGEVRQTLLRQAEQHRSLALAVWNSPAKANRMAQLAADANTISELTRMVQEESERWGEGSNAPAVRELRTKMLHLLQKTIPDEFKEQIRLAGAESAKQYGAPSDVKRFTPDPDWQQDQLLQFARLYILTLVAHHRIASGTLC
jgi:hypothetical protein